MNKRGRIPPGAMNDAELEIEYERCRKRVGRLRKQITEAEKEWDEAVQVFVRRAFIIEVKP